jgi:hypothetical protein
MHLYYDFQVRQALPQILSARQSQILSKKVEKAVQREVQTANVLKGKTAEFMLRVMAMKKKKGKEISRKEVEKEYLKYEIVKGYLEGKWGRGKKVGEVVAVVEDEKKREVEESKWKKRNLRKDVKVEEGTHEVEVVGKRRGKSKKRKRDKTKNKEKNKKREKKEKKK